MRQVRRLKVEWGRFPLRLPFEDRWGFPTYSEPDGKGPKEAGLLATPLHLAPKDSGGEEHSVLGDELFALDSGYKREHGQGV